jgi:transcriptional regulator with XRE-family HTH domain
VAASGRRGIIHFVALKRLAKKLHATNLRRLRHEKQLSQEELALKARINRTYVSKLEGGKTWAGLEIIAKLSRVLNTEPADLLRRPPRSKKL